MADNTKIWPIFRWANWWLSDDLFTGIRNSFYYSNNIEIREDSKSIFPKWVPAYADAIKWVNIGDGTTWNHKVVCSTYSVSGDWYYSWWIICCENNIYISNSQWVTLLCTMPEQICDMEIFNWYVYISTLTHLYYKRDDWLNRELMSEATDNSDDDYWICPDTLTSNGWHPLYASDTCLCVWDVNKMWKVTREIWNDMDDWFELQKWYYIRFISELWWFIRAVAVNEPYWSEVLLWDKESIQPTEVIPLQWYTMLQSCIYNWYHYLLSNKGLWLLNWYQYYILKKADWDINSDVKNWMVVYDDKLYFIANKWIYIYWAKNKNYNDVLWLWHKVEDWYSLWAIGVYWNDIMITRNYKQVSGDDNIPVRVWINEWLATTWEIQTMWYFWNSMSEIKQAMYLRVWYHLGKQWENSGNIHIYYRTEADATTDNPDEWQWHELTKTDWLYAQWDMRSPFATTLKLNCRFQWIQFKFVLTNCQRTDSWTKYTRDTNLYSADLYYNDMLD